MSVPLEYLRRFLQSSLSEDLGWVLVHSLWQVALVAAVYAIAAVVLRNRSATLRYLLGCAAMVAMLVAPVVTYCVLPASVEPALTIALGVEPVGPIVQPIPPGASETEASVPSDELAGAPAPPIPAEEEPSPPTTVSQAIRPWLPTASLLWLLGVVLLSSRPLVGWFHVRRLRRQGVSPLSESTHRVCDRLVNRLGIRRVVEFAQSALVEAPTIVGFLRPIVLLPASTISGLTTAELELILAHELAHVRRHDYLVNLAQTVLEALLFYHPAMWWVSTQVRHERENCCDDIAVAMSGDRATYIRALMQLEEHRVVAPALAATGGSLLARVRRLLGAPADDFSHRDTTAWLAGLLVIALVVATLATGDASLAQSIEDSEETPAVEKVDNEDLASTDDELVSSFGASVGREVAEVIRRVDLPFIDDTRLKEIERDFERFVNQDLLAGTFSTAPSLTSEDQQAILSAIRDRGAKHLHLDPFERDDPGSISNAYVGLPDKLSALKWKLYLAINNSLMADNETSAKLDSQRRWMREYLRSLPESGTFTTDMALAELEERFADPLCCTLGSPMPEERFALFKRRLESNSSKRKLTYHVWNITLHSFWQRYRGFSRIPELPGVQKDRVYSFSLHRSTGLVYLGFASNRAFQGTFGELGDLEASATVIDAKTGELVTAPEGWREPSEFRQWLTREGLGDVYFDDAKGGVLGALRGAKIARLPVKAWFEADAISNAELRELIQANAAESIVSLEQDFQSRDRDCYVGVLTKEGALAVVAVVDFSDRSKIWIRTRVRPALPADESGELSDEDDARQGAL